MASEHGIEVNLASVEFYVTYNLLERFRSYDKIQDGFAFFYVFQKMLENIIRVFYNPYLYSDYLMYAFSKMYRFEIDEESEESKAQRELVTIENQAIITESPDGSPSKKVMLKKNTNPDNPKISSTDQLDPELGSEFIQPGIVPSGTGNGPHNCLNKNLHILIDHVKKPRKEVKMSHWDITGAHACCISKDGDLRENERWFKMELIRNAEIAMSKRMHVMENSHLIDRYEYLEQFVLS